MRLVCLLSATLLCGCAPVFRPVGGEKVLGAKQFVSYLDSLNLQKDWDRFQRLGYEKCAVIDVDGTLWKDDFSAAFVKQTLDERMVSPEAVRPLNGILTFFGLEPGVDAYDAIRRLRSSRQDRSIYESGKAKGLSEFKTEEVIWPWWNYLYVGFKSDDVDQRMRALFAKDGIHKVFPEMEEIVAYLRREEFKIYFVSAGLDMAAKIGGEFFGIAPAHCRGVMTTTTDGIITSEVIRPIPHHSGKAELSRTFCGGRPFIAFGDSVTSTDGEMLAMAHIAVAVEPKPQHAAGAREKGYIILDFDRTRDGSPADAFQRKQESSGAVSHK